MYEQKNKIKLKEKSQKLMNEEIDNYSIKQSTKFSKIEYNQAVF